MKRLKSMLLLCSLPLLALACGSPESEDSATKWAHLPTASSISVINSRLQFLDLGFKTNFSKVSVCIQDASHFNESDLLLETKLAYAAWLKASGQGSEKIWQYLDFTIQNHCDMKDNNYSSVVVIGDESKLSPDQDIQKNFQQNKVSCKKSGGNANCSTGSMTLGWGSPGSLTYSYYKAGQWTGIRNHSPATVILSPYVEWKSMAADLKDARMKTTYSALASHADWVSFEELNSFNQLLQAQKIISRNNDQLSIYVDQFLNSGLSSQTSYFMPVKPAFHVLLHEVGHQFGMNHADNPDLDSETGTVGNANLNGANSKWETDFSTMAYAEEYLYLTEDDRVGISDLAGKNLTFVKSHRPF